MSAASPLVTVSAATRAGSGINQDRYFLGDGFAVVLDGASTPDPQRLDGGWYADVLGSAIGRRLRQEPTAELRSTLADAIQEATERGSLTPGCSPSSTVTIARWTSDYLDGLVLGDSPVIVQTTGGIEDLRDDRLAKVADHERGAYRDALRRGDGYGERHRSRMRRLVDAERAHRNRPGGYWIAEAEPRAAAHAMSKRWALRELRAAMLATDGLSRGVEQFGRPASWEEAIEISRTADLDTLLHIVEDAETSDPHGSCWPRGKRHDDKTAVLISFEMNDNQGE